MLWGINDLSSQPRLVKQRTDRNKLLFVLIQQAVFQREFQNNFDFLFLQNMKLQPVHDLNLERIVYTQVVRWNPYHLCNMDDRTQLINWVTKLTEKDQKHWAKASIAHSFVLLLLHINWNCWDEVGWCCGMTTGLSTNKLDFHHSLTDDLLALGPGVWYTFIP